MEPLSGLTLGLLMTLLALTVVLIPSAIIFNLKAGLKYRETLARQLDQLRLGKMLLALGIDINQYLHRESTNLIHEQIQRCQDCDNTRSCDEDLSEGIIDPERISYCNNEGTLKNIVLKQAEEK